VTERNGPAGGITITGPRLRLRPLRPEEIDAEWQAMVTADPMTIAELPDEAAFRARLRRSGQLTGGWLDLAIDAGGTLIGRIQTFVPAGRPLPPGTFEIGIGLRAGRNGRPARQRRPADQAPAGPEPGPAAPGLVQPLRSWVTMASA